MGVLHPYLVGAAREELHLGEGQALPHRLGPGDELRLLRAGRVFLYRAHHARAAVLDEPVGECALTLDLTLHHRQIAPILLVGAKGLAEPRRSLGRAREHHHAAHRAIQPVYQAQIHRAGLVVLLRDVALQDG